MTLVQLSPDQQRDLYALQEVDTAIRQLDLRRANLPEQQALDVATAERNAVDAELADARERLQRLEVQSRRHEQEIAAVEARRRSEEARMYGGLIQSEKELEALRNEIAALRSRKNDLEDSVLEIMEQSEEVTELVTRLDTRAEELRQSIQTITAARDEAATGIDAELATQRRARSVAAAKLPADALEFYDALRARKNGVAVALLEGRTCTGCRLELTAIELEEVNQASRTSMARCQQCARILVTR